jgi:hypothetical protein
VRRKVIRRLVTIRRYQRVLACSQRSSRGYGVRPAVRYRQGYLPASRDEPGKLACPRRRRRGTPRGARPPGPSHPACVRMGVRVERRARAHALERRGEACHRAAGGEPRAHERGGVARVHLVSIVHGRAARRLHEQRARARADALAHDERAERTERCAAPRVAGRAERRGEARACVPADRLWGLCRCERARSCTDGFVAPAATAWRHRASRPALPLLVGAGATDSALTRSCSMPLRAPVALASSTALPAVAARGRGRVGIGAHALYLVSLRVHARSASSGS